MELSNNQLYSITHFLDIFISRCGDFPVYCSKLLIICFGSTDVNGY